MMCSQVPAVANLVNKSSTTVQEMRVNQPNSWVCTIFLFFLMKQRLLLKCSTTNTTQPLHKCTGHECTSNECLKSQCTGMNSISHKVTHKTI